ncbi:MAG: hypothetical protein ABR569_00415 [Gaiellaceae bacterium]
MSTVANWVPRALRDAPTDVDGAPRLLDLLLGGVDEQCDLLAADIDRLWDDLFIESCADWAVPYIGALVGLPPDAERLEVAYAIALRRRKGTPAALEDFAEVVTGLTARVLEGWQLTTWAQRLGHPPPPRVASMSLADAGRFRIGTPFDRVRHSFTPSGPYDPRAATAVVWPWRVGSFRAVEAAPLPEPRRFALHPLGAEAPPYLKPQAGRNAAERASGELRARTGDELDAPVRATYAVAEALAGPGQITYGVNWTIDPAHPLAQTPEPQRPILLELTLDGTAIPWTKLRFGSLPYGGPAPAPPTATQALVDLSRGHVELGSSLTGTLRSTWNRPIASGLGPLASDLDADPAARVIVVVDPAAVAGPLVANTLADAIAKAEAASADLDPVDSRPDRPDVEIRLATSDRLAAPPPQSFAPTLQRWRIVAQRRLTPIVVGDVDLDLAGCCLALEGFYLTGDLVLGKTLDGVALAFVTMDPAAPGTIRIAHDAWGIEFSARRSILGALRAELGARPLQLEDSIVDGLGARLRTCGEAPGATLRDAVAAQVRFAPALVASGVTFAGPVHTESIDAADCIFGDGVEAVQQQEGCLRHCYLGPDLSTPPSRPVTYRCGPFPAPTFASIGFEAAGYYALDLEREQPLLSAASDGGEVGAANQLRRGARLERLRRRVHEFVPLGLRAGIALAPWEE